MRQAGGIPKGKASAAPPIDLTDVDLVGTVRKTLEDAGRLETVLGQVAMVLASRLRAVSPETAAAMAAVSKELRAVMGEALADAEGSDPVDELKSRRERKLVG